MTRVWLAIAGLGGGASVIAGALATHLAEDPKSAELLRTGALYGMVHASALVAVIALAQEPRAAPGRGRLGRLELRGRHRAVQR